MTATFQVSVQERFNFSRPEEWPKWIRPFERFRMGDEVDAILRSLDLSQDDRKKYSAVKDKFHGHFVKRRNDIFERAKFNMRKQEERQPVFAFISGLYSLAEHCAYGSLHNEMIRNRIVKGILNSALSERLQLDAALMHTGISSDSGSSGRCTL